MIRKILFVFGFLISLTAAAQPGKLVSAWNYYTYYLEDKSDQKSLLSARDAINAAAEHEKTIAKAKTWFYKGLIYQAIVESQDEELLRIEPDALLIAVKAYRKAVSLDEKKKHRIDITENLKSLTIFLDHHAGNAFNDKDFQRSFELFHESYKLIGFIENAYGERRVDTAAMIGTAYSAEKLGKNELSMQVYEELLALPVNDASIYLSLADIYKEKGDTAKALEVLEKGQSVNPANVDLIINQVNIYLAQGKKNDALINKLEKAIELEPDNFQLPYALGTVFDRMSSVERLKESKDRDYTYLRKNIDRARALYQRSDKLKTGNYDVIYNLGALYFNEAATDLQGMINDLTTEQEELRDRLISERDDMLQKAIPFFDKALTLRPNDLNSLIALKEIYSRLGDDRKAQDISRKISDLKSK
jgi:tetratricopeptide (TPR) repeat protein